MRASANEVLRRYRTRGVLPDSNLLLLYFVGAWNRDEVSRFKRTRKYTVEDFDLLVRVLEFFETVATTPHVLTEVSNLAGQLPSDKHEAFFSRFGKGIELLLDERHASAAGIADRPEFTRFGLTDAGIQRVARGKFLVLTDDFRLSQYLVHLDIAAFNFDDVRKQNLL